MVAWVLRINNNNLNLFLIVVALCVPLYGTGATNKTEMTGDTAQAVSLLPLRSLSGDRIQQQFIAMQQQVKSVTKRRVMLTLAGTTAVMAGCCWWLFGSHGKQLKGRVSGKAPTIDYAVGELFLEDLQERRSFKGLVKQGLIFGLSTATVSFVLKRLDACWERSSEATPLLHRLWGYDARQQFARSVMRFQKEVQLMKDALICFSSGLQLAEQAAQDAQLKVLVSRDLCVAWEALVAAFEDIMVVAAVIKKAGDPIAFAGANQAVYYFTQVLNGVVQWAYDLVEHANGGKEQHMRTLAMGRKLEIGAQQFVDFILR